MSIQYSDLFHLKLTHLDEAIDVWTQRIHRLKEIETDYQDDVAKSFKRAGWHSSDSTSEGAAKRSEQIARELRDALKVARTVKDAVARAKTELHAKRRALHDLVDHEIPPKFRVTTRGQVIVREGQSASDHASSEEATPSLDRALQREAQEVAQWQSRIKSILNSAADADAEVAQILNYALGGGEGFRSSPDALSPGRGAGEPKKTATQTASAPFGSKTIKPAAEFLSYKSWINAGSAVLDGRGKDAVTYFWGGVPSYASGKASSLADKGWPGASGSHRKLSPLNKVGIVGGKIFSAPVAIAATAVDYAYTPESRPEEKERQSRTVAPDAPPRRRVD